MYLKVFLGGETVVESWFVHILLPLSKLKQAIICINVYCSNPFDLEKSMSARKNTQSRRNYLVKCPCPSCSKDSEHSYNRVQKGAQLICPYCSALFKSSQRI